jgi:Leucine-rich repeat (LRR) protein
VLKLDHNVLQGSLIAEIRKMPLITLDVSYNNMTGVPAEIGQISTLQTLNYSYNKITAFPNEIANIKQLKTLTITGNPLSADKVTQLKAELPNTTIIF